MSPAPAGPDAARGPRPRALLSWSGGKDAAWALHVLRERGEVEVVALLATISGDGDDARASLQGIRVEVLRRQAAAAGLPLIEVAIAPGAGNDAYASAFASALEEARARWPGIDAIAFGDLSLADIRAWREALCARLGWHALFPLFGSDTAALARTMQAGGLRARLCCIDTTQLDRGFAGRAFDAALLVALPAGVDPCGERGEFHTCAWAGPMFAAPIALDSGGTVLHEGRFAVTDFLPVD